MNSKLLVRPNLKLFLLGAVIVVIIHQLVTEGLSQDTARPILVSAREPIDPAIERILAQADHLRASQVYGQLSAYYEEQGDYRRALRYLRLSNRLLETESDGD